MSQRSIALLTSTLLLLIFSADLLSQNTSYPATDQRIHVTGRTSKNGTALKFDWPGIQIAFSFNGSYAACRIEDSGSSWFELFVDGKRKEKINVHSDTLMVLASDLNPGNHTVMLYKRTEAKEGLTTLHNIEINPGGTLLPYVVKTERRIEFIGNSITCGYGVDSNVPKADFIAEQENAYMAFAAITARAFNAEHHLIAHSGKGVVRNYGDSKTTSPNTMTTRFKQVLDSDEMLLWDFSKWTPNAVVINLGTNDFSTHPHPHEAIFNKRYISLINFIREQYGDIPIFCLNGPMINEPCYTYVKKMVDGQRNFLKDNNIYFIGIPQALMDPKTDVGAYHPNASGQQKMANMIIPVIASVTGWSYTQ